MFSFKRKEKSPDFSPPPAALREYVLRWAARDEYSLAYAQNHIRRLTRTLELTPRGGSDDRVLEMGVYFHITPALRYLLGYGDVRGCYFGEAGKTEQKRVTSAAGETFDCAVDLFNAEKDRFPYADAWFATVLCCELIEHLASDPMHLLSEVNRILRPGGCIILTTPNAASLRGITGILEGRHPGFFPQYIRPAADGSADPRHSREYTPSEIRQLMQHAGFAVEHQETGPFSDVHEDFSWARAILEHNGLSTDLRDDCIYTVARRERDVVDRYPGWLYA
jgi:SAM-dependent methyltransferase